MLTVLVRPGRLTMTLGGFASCPGELPVSELWTANLQLPVCLLGIVLPKDFNRSAQYVSRLGTAANAYC